MPVHVLSVERAVIGTLLEELGGWNTFRVLLNVAWAQITYRPFRELDSEDSGPERLARAHVRDAVILWRALHGTQPRGARRIFSAAMSKGAQAFLSKNIGIINGDRYRLLSADERHRWLKHLIALFPNATARVDEVSDIRVAFTVSRCRYVELATVAGYPELGHVFCAGDAAFFESQPLGISFQRNGSIADGDACCPFVLTMIEEPEGSTDRASE